MESYVKFKVPIDLLSALIQHSNTRSMRSLAYYKKVEDLTPKRLANKSKWERLRFSHSKIATKVEGERDMFYVTLPKDAAEYMFDSYNKELKTLYARNKRDFQRKYLSDYLEESWSGPVTNDLFYDERGINSWRRTAMPTVEPILIPLTAIPIDIKPFPSPMSECLTSSSEKSD
jgi:hypothetical protein